MVATLLLLGLVGCKAPGSGDAGPVFGDDRDFGFQDGALTDVTGTVSGIVPTVVHVQWTSAEAGASYVSYGLDGALDQQTPQDAGGTDHDVLVLGLKAGRSYTLQAVTLAGDGAALSSGTGSVTLDPAPESLGTFHVTVGDAQAMQPGGYILTSLLQQSDSWMVVLDRDGEPVWYYPATAGFSIPTTHPGRDGSSLLFTQSGLDQDQDISDILRVSMDGSQVTTTRALLGHHAFVELPDHRFAWVSLDIRDAYVDGQTLTLAGDTVLEIDEGATDADTPTEVFNFFDDWGTAPYRMCRHCDAEAYQTGAQDWTHSNSLMYVEDQDDLYLMSKNLDAVLRIDRSSGQLVWQLGGQESDFTGPDGAWWSHGHMSQLWDGGMVVFDNGYHHEPVRSRVVAYRWDEGARTVSPTFQYTDPQGRFIQLLGDGRLLENGNVLASWTAAGLLTEVTPDDAVVWRLESDLGTAIGRVTMLRDLYTLDRAEAH